MRGREGRSREGGWVLARKDGGMERGSEGATQGRDDGRAGGDGGGSRIVETWIELELGRERVMGRELG